MKRWTGIRKFGGKQYKAQGPFYCPGGVRADEMKDYIKELREKHYVRIDKHKIQPGETFLYTAGNKYVVWLWVRRKK